MFARIITAAAAAAALFATLGVAQAQRLAEREGVAEREAPICHDAVEAEYARSCSLTDDGCWYTGGCGTPHSQLAGFTPHMEGMLNSCHTEAVPDNCWLTNQIGKVTVTAEASLCSYTHNTLNHILGGITEAAVPSRTVITGYDVLRVDDYEATVEVSYARISCFYESEVDHQHFDGDAF